MAQSIFNTEEQNVVRNTICQQLYISNEELKVAIESNDLVEIVIHSTIARDCARMAHDIPNFICQWSISDYETMVKPLERFIDMATDSFENDELHDLYTAAAALAKIKIHFELFK